MDSGAIIGVVARSLTRSVLAAAAGLVVFVGFTPATAATAGGFTVTPNVADSTCNGGLGVQVATHAFKNSAIASGAMGNGSTLTSFGQIYPGQAYVVLDAVDEGCAPDSQFGDGGTTRITIPDGLITKPGDFGLWINAIAPRSDGGALLAGVYRDRWVLAAVTAQGALDPAFGTSGWTALPLAGEATEVLEEPSGEILVGGDNSGGGCCTVNHAAELTAQGQLDTGFGTNGRVTLPTGEDSGVSSLSQLPNGDILAQVNYGNMGCWGHRLAMFTSSGTPVPGFDGRMNRFWRIHPFGAFVGDAYVDGNGFTLVGSGQQPCADGRHLLRKPPHGLIAHFTADGAVVGHSMPFPSQLYGEISAFKHGPNTLVVEGSLQNASTELLRLLRPDGTTIKSYGADGVVRVRLPWVGSHPDVFASAPTSLVVVATEDGRTTMAVTRLTV